MRSRVMRLGIGTLIAFAAFVLVAVVPRVVERRVAERLVAEAARRGVALHIGAVRFSWLGTLRLEDVTFGRGAVSGGARRSTVWWRPARRLASWPRAVSFDGAWARSGDLEVSLGPARWDLLALGRDRVEVAHRGPRSSLVASWRRDGGLECRASAEDLDALVSVRRRGAPFARFGRASGRLALGAPEHGIVPFELLGISSGVRVASLGDEEQTPALGAPMDVEAAASGIVVPAWGRAELACWRFATSGVDMSGDGGLEYGAGDVWADVTLDVPRFALGPVVAASGLTLDVDGAALPADLGSATLTAELSGHLLDPDSISVEQKLVFHRPPAGVPALAYLNGPFTHTVELPERDLAIRVAEGAPGYVRLEDVPPLFLRALTISEDAAFWNHPGIDLSEIPVALATNWKRGERARGGSTITQQLVKNLFLSRRKSVGRKLQEAALALLVESAVPKRRILEIYLNVIEWGPELYGLGPASRRYFGKEPRDLTPKEIAFLVALIPGPVKYQRSFAGGVLTPRFGSLVHLVLAKLRSVDAISEEEYEKAVSEPLVFAPPLGPGAAAPEVPAEEPPATPTPS